jgi:hypothetical protein
MSVCVSDQERTCAVRLARSARRIGRRHYFLLLIHASSCRNYEEWTGFTGNQDDFRLLWNAIVSMNTVPEYLALDQLGYAQVSREVLDDTAKQIRDKDQSLIDLKFCAETLKHVRKIPRKQKQGPVTITISSTIASPIDRDTWTICSHDLIDVAERAFKALSALPELR